MVIIYWKVKEVIFRRFKPFFLQIKKPKDEWKRQIPKNTA